MSNKDNLLENENNKIEPFDKIEQVTKRYIPNIPSVISDMKKNNIYQKEMEINNDESIKKDKKNEIIEFNENKNQQITSINEAIDKKSNKNNNDAITVICNYWNTFRNNDTVSTIINPFQDDGECVNKVYKIYSCITITLILIVILLSITLS